MTDSIKKTVFLKAPPATVWAFLTEREKLARWFHPAEEDLADGQDYALVDETPEGMVKQCWGTVQHWEPPKKLVYSFTVKPLQGVMTTVTWRLDDIQGGTRLSLVHEGFGAADEAAFGLLMALDKGWDEHFAKLRQNMLG